MSCRQRTSLRYYGLKLFLSNDCWDMIISKSSIFVCSCCTIDWLIWLATTPPGVIHGYNVVYKFPRLCWVNSTLVTVRSDLSGGRFCHFETFLKVLLRERYFV